MRFKIKTVNSVIALKRLLDAVRLVGLSTRARTAKTARKEIAAMSDKELMKFFEAADLLGDALRGLNWCPLSVEAEVIDAAPAGSEGQKP